MEEILYYLLENKSDYYISYKQIRNFIKNNKLKDEIVFKDLYITDHRFILLSSKKGMKELERLCKNSGTPVQKLITESLLSNNLLLSYIDGEEKKDLEINIKIDKEDKTISLNTSDIEFVFKILLN